MIVLAIDPGRDKTGVAVVDDNLKVYDRDIVNSDEISKYLNKMLYTYKIDLIVLGDGTTSEKMKSRLYRITESKIPVNLVDESNSTQEAEARYRSHHPLRGWKKLLRFISWKPAAAVDDYVAVILAERYLQKDK